MVYQDISDQKSSATPAEFRYKVPLMDRFFAFVIDYLIFSPFVSFVLFIFFKDAIRYWRMNPTAPEQVTLTFLLGLSYIALFSALQAVFIRVWRATPGQYYLKMQIVFENGEGLIFWRAFCRQSGFWLSIFCLGIPWMALLSHPLQKTFYDRMADCRVLSKKISPTYFSFEGEGRYWQSFMATLILFVSLIFCAALFSQYRDVNDRTESFKQYEKKNFFCSELKGASPASRLQLAIAMNLVGQLSDECLDRESDFVLWKEKNPDLSLAYYAKSLTESDPDIENTYLAKACETQQDGIGCHVAKAFLTAEFNSLYLYLKTQKGILASTLSYEFAQMDHPEDVFESFASLSNYDSNRMMKKYLLTELISRNADSSRAPASVEEDMDAEEQALDLIKDL